MACLTAGFLDGLRQVVALDSDLNLDIRENYLNVYFKGNSLLKLTQRGLDLYPIALHPKFSDGLDLPDVLEDAASTDRFLNAIPLIKRNIIRYGKRSLEIEYEQMIIRANNYEPRNNSEYFIVDRQYAVKEGRFDLTGLFWARRGRRKHQVVPLCLFEVKFALNHDIAHIDQQLERYYKAIQPKATDIAAEVQGIFRQKLNLGLYRLPADRLAAMKTLRLSPDILTFQFVLLLVDYNPNSKSLNLARLNKLPFKSQVRILHTGFSMWQQRVLPLAEA
jgi:hypothetical protein